jgi:hypothetical protein
MPGVPAQHGLIPDDLLSNIKKGDCVLFLGADLPLGYPGAPASRPELAAALAEKYNLPAGLSWPETVQAYLGRFPRDRNGVIRFVQERCSGPQIQPGPLHRAIAGTGFRAIVTAAYDELLEQALKEAGYRVNRVVRDTQLPYAEEGERSAIVVKLYGCLSDPESLVLDLWEHERLMDQLSRKLEVVTAFCTLRPPLFANFDLLQGTPIRLYVRASANLADHMRRAYAVWPGELDAVQATWQGQNVAFCRGDAAAFLEALAGQAALPGAGPGRRIRVHRPPYKFLDYYRAEDADIFCGRDTESQVVKRLILSHRLLTLFGPSGAGKTSLLLAGVLPQLAAEEYRHVYVRALDDPLPAMRKAIAVRAGRDDWQAGDRLADFLAAMLAPKDRLIVVLDQFEELFLRVGGQKRGRFFQELAEALDGSQREVRVVFSLREDYLAHLDEARPFMPDVLSNSFRLAALDRFNARIAVTEPAARAGVQVEPALVDALVGKAGETGGGVLVEESSGLVPPPALQIVLYRLYRGALRPDHAESDPPPPGLTLTLADYRAIRRVQGRDEGSEQARELTGAAAILAGYVDEGLARLPGLTNEDATPLGADAELGEAILKVMVTSRKTKAALTHGEIVAALDEAGAIDMTSWRDQGRVEAARLGLERVRLLRGFQRDAMAYYELTHDTLAGEIAARISAAEMLGKLARELLRRGMDDWRSSARLLLRPEVLALINERRDELKNLSADELELLLRSTLAAGYEVPYWFERAFQGNLAVDALALEGLESGNFRTRAAAVTALAQLGERFADHLILMLADLYPQVRVAAIAALEHLRPDGAWRSNLKYECYVPEGEFIIGEDKIYFSDAHPVYTDAYYIGKYPVTNWQYGCFMVSRDRDFEMPQGKENHPVVNVPWHDARDYADWAGMRLLTEAEWEKAASWDVETTVVGRPGRKRKYPWGDTFDKRKCNTSLSGIGETTPVGTYSPAGDSPCGAADMGGNVWEWCSSQYKDYPYSAGDGRENSKADAYRVVRGGSFHDEESFARCAARYRYGSFDRYDDLGFRVGWAAPSSGL